MSTTQQPEALALADEVRMSMPHDVLKLWAAEAASLIRRQHTELETLRAGYAAARLEIESLRARVGEAPAGEYPALPNPVGWRDKNMHCDLYWKPSQLALVAFEPLFTEAQMRAYVDADRAMLRAAPQPSPASQGDALSQAARDVLAERQRQVSAEGWTPEHDDEHVNDEIAAMACYYVMPQGAREWSGPDGYGATLGDAIRPDGWDAKACDRRRELVKGAALALAELERMDRADAARAAQESK